MLPLTVCESLSGTGYPVLVRLRRARKTATGYLSQSLAIKLVCGSTGPLGYQVYDVAKQGNVIAWFLISVSEIEIRRLLSQVASTYTASYLRHTSGSTVHTVETVLIDDQESLLIKSLNRETNTIRVVDNTTLNTDKLVGIEAPTIDHTVYSPGRQSSPLVVRIAPTMVSNDTKQSARKPNNYYFPRGRSKYRPTTGKTNAKTK